MCGIFGVVNSDQKLTSQILDSLIHRGPDAGRIWEKTNPKITLGHRRLSIIDLDESANQPFQSDDGRYVMVYNGEFYNYKDIATKYRLKLRTHSDTEVLLEFMIKAGWEQITEVNGMFALAVYDQEAEILYLYRDRLGIKPLYYYDDGKSFAFASELPALKSLVGELEINREAIPYFLHRGYIPEPMTLYKDVYKFPAGSMGVYQKGKLKIESYWRPEDQIREKTLSSEADVLRQVEELLRDSVGLRLMADVPFGTFLSGGADSGLITAMAADLVKEPIHTFNVSFEEAVFDESPYAKAMAEHLEIKYHHIRVSRKEVMENLRTGMDLVGEPFADSSIFPTMAVSKFAAQHVKMVLSGDGGDELFMGYGAYTWADRMEKYWPYRQPVAALLRLSGSARNKRAANVFDCTTKAELRTHIFSQEQNLFSRKEVEKILGSGFRDEFSQPKLLRELQPAEEQAFFDLCNYLKDDLLVKVDRASMHYSLEARVPFLDHRIVELALNIDPALKRKNGETKYLVKKILERYYPKELVYRKKWGFSIPLQKWMQSSIQEMSISESMLSNAWSDNKRQYQEKENDFLYNRLYILMVLSRYL